MASRLTKENYNGAAYNDVHMNTAKGTLHGLKDIHMATSKSSLYGDVRMDTAGSTFRKGGLNPFEREIADSPEVKRKATVAQLYFLDYYFQMLGYLSARKERRAAFTQDTADRGLTHSEYMKEWKSYCGRERVLLRKRRAKLRLDQFHIIAQVGQGGYGEVFLARKRESGEVCALKKMRKSTLHKMDEIRHVLVERDILTATRTPWLVRLLYAFQDTTYVYLAMEYVPGGDFRTLMNNSGVLKEEYARFYIAEMFMAVNELHKLGYIHRDLKPENFLVDGTGHVKLTDFGLATGALNPTRIESLKIKLDRAKDNTPTIRSTLERRSGFQKLLRADPRYADSIVGSPDYMAPEVLRAKAYTYSVDYWSLGCILFEFLAGFPPFTGETPEETWTNLKKWTSVLQRPHYEKEEDQIFNLSDVAWDAITRLIAHASIRYTTLSQIQRHPFFRPLSSQSPNWDHLRSIPAPFVPQLESEEDTMYYDDFTNEEDMAKYQEVIEKQKAVAGVKEVEEPSNAKRGVWVGFTFGRGGPNTRAVQGMQGVDETGSLVTIF